ncbi:hypothetical protein [Cohnella faecalis]|uniref:Uncharacterized protein n=1 Tax=Cohnella faecalis TaxID=2315694 RepID=A0A398CJ31_9BACL|nr:hypothetical protein [Cohnella faecalis]RIE02330.1 hypothetical protein D3H35_16565 [Cohnella faecalis]
MTHSRTSSGNIVKLAAAALVAVQVASFGLGGSASAAESPIVVNVDQIAKQAEWAPVSTGGRCNCR